MPFKIPNLGFFRGTWLPDTVFDASDEGSFSGQNGMSMRPVEPMRSWQLRFKGEASRVSDPGDVIEVDLSGMWSSDDGFFDYDTDMSPSATARAFAKEPWTRQYFKDLQRSNTL